MLKFETTEKCRKYRKFLHSLKCKTTAITVLPCWYSKPQLIYSTYLIHKSPLKLRSTVSYTSSMFYNINFSTFYKIYEFIFLFLNRYRIHIHVYLKNKGKLLFFLTINFLLILSFEQKLYKNWRKQFTLHREDNILL